MGWYKWGTATGGQAGALNTNGRGLDSFPRPEVKNWPRSIQLNQLEQLEEFKVICDLEPSHRSQAVSPWCNINNSSWFINCFEGYNMCQFQLLRCPFRAFISTNEFNYFNYGSKILCGMKMYAIIRLLMKTLTYLCVIENESLTVSEGWC